MPNTLNKIIFVALSIIFLTQCNANRLPDKSNKDNNQNWAMTGFVKADSINPILYPSRDQVFICPIGKKEVRWEERNVLNPSAIVKDNKVYLIYRAQDNQMTSRLGLAISEDGLHFKKQADPVFYPDNDSMMPYEWKGGIEDPRIIESEDGIYVMTYTAYDGKLARLCLATSKDLTTWEKQGLVLGEKKYRDFWSKSGAIVAKYDGGKIKATKINGKYWMYFGDTDLFMATSDDLIHWLVAENEENRKMISVLHPRMGYFDSRLVEPGPYALLTEKGILLIYNGSNAASFNDPAFPKFTYSAGQALFDKKNPFKLISRLEDPFIYPDKPYEKTGEVNEVCFVEGLVNFRNQWFLYYGTADSKIAVSIKKENKE
jgi:predicted GH43/DUF377 family glycosyl hydrolase